MTRCVCPNCDSQFAHQPGKCRRLPVWFVEYHAVDRCKEFQPFQGEVCDQCFERFAALAKRTIAWALEGVRSPLCGGCFKPLIRISNIIQDVGRV